MPNGLRAIAGIFVLVVWQISMANESVLNEFVWIPSAVEAASPAGLFQATPGPIPVGSDQPRQSPGGVGILSPDVVNLLIGVVGALVGAIVTYIFAVRDREQDIATRSNVLVAALFDELNDIEGVLPSYAPGRIFYRDPIRLSALQRLLEGSTLNSRTDAKLIGLLISMHTATSTYNDFASSFNLAQMSGSIPPDSHAQMYQDLVLRLQRVVQHKKALVEHLETRTSIGEIGESRYVRESN